MIDSIHQTFEFAYNGLSTGATFYYTLVNIPACTYVHRHLNTCQLDFQHNVICM